MNSKKLVVYLTMRLKLKKEDATTLKNRFYLKLLNISSLTFPRGRLIV